MTIPRLSGWWDEIAPSAEKLVPLFDSYINPNRRLQQMMQAEVAKNPQLLQQFADLRANDPEILKRMGIDNVDFMVQGLPQSTANIVDKKKRDIFTSPTTPEEDVDIRSNVLGTQTPTQRRQADINIQKGEQDLRIGRYDELFKEAFAPLFSKEAQVKGASLDESLRVFNEGARGIEALKKLSDNYENRTQLSPEELNLLSSNPRFKEEFDRIRDDYWKENAKKFQVEFSASERRNNLLYQAMLRNAEEVADVGGVPFQIAMQFATLPVDDQKRIMESTTPPEDIDPLLWKAGQGVKHIAGRKEASHLRNTVNFFYKDPSFVSSIRTVQAKGRNAKDKQAAIETINSIFRSKAAELGMANPPVWELKKDDGGFFGRTTYEPTIVSGDFGLSTMLAAEGGITVNAPAEAAKKEQDAKLLEDDDRITQIAQNLELDLAAAKSPAERDMVMENFMANKLPADIKAKVRAKLPRIR